jgi:hypothetical protein
MILDPKNDGFKSLWFGFLGRSIKQKEVLGTGCGSTWGGITGIGTGEKGMDSGTVLGGYKL